MPATSSIQLSGGQKDYTSSSEIPKPDHKDPPRRGKKKPFEYKKGRSKHQNVGASSQISEEKKMDERITHTRADIRPHNDDSMPDFKQIENKSVEYYAPAVRKISEADAKESSIGMPQGVQIDLGSSEVEKRADEGDQVDLGESEQERVKEKASEGVQIDLGDSSTRVQRMGKNNASEGVQIDLGDSSTRVQAVGKNNASEGIQIDFGDSESDIPIGFTNNISEGIQIDFGDSSTETKRKSQDNISEGIQIDFEEESEQIQRYPRNRISEGMQIDIDTRSQGIKAHPEPGVSVGNQYDLNNKISQRIQKLPERTHRRGIQADPYPTRTQGIQIYPDSTKSQGLQISPEKMKSEGFQIRPEPQKCEGVQMSAISVTSEGNQVGTSILTPVSYISVGNKGIQFDADNYNRSIQADEQPLKDIDIQCDRSENEKEIQADPEYISRGQSAGSGSLLSPFRANEVEDYHYHRPISRDSNLIDFSCQFSYHTVESTEGEININPEIESEETEERTLTQSVPESLSSHPDQLGESGEEERQTVIPIPIESVAPESESASSEPQSFLSLPESLSSHPDQLSSSENERMSVVKPPPNLDDIKAKIKQNKKGRSSSFFHNKQKMDQERNMALLDQPYVPEGVRHKKEKSENPSESSGSYMEERYYNRRPSEESTKAKTKSRRRNPNFVQNPKVGVMVGPERSYPEGAPAYNKGRKEPNKRILPANTMLSGHSLDSRPVRLDGSYLSPLSEENKDVPEFETPSEVEELYNDLFKTIPQNIKNPSESASQKSKDSGPLNSQRDHQKDWANTPLYEEYAKAGITLKNSKFDPTFSYKKYNRQEGESYNFYNEQESKEVYEFVRNRYESQNYDKSIKPFYETAMNTL